MQTVHKKPSWNRRKLIVYPKLQLLVLVYGTVCAILGSFINTIFYRALIQQDQGFAFSEYIPLIAVIVVQLAVLICALAFSNKVFGPIYRLQRVMKESIGSNKVEPIVLRPGDEFQDLIADFNSLIKEKNK